MQEAPGIHVVGAAIITEGRCFVAQRGPEMTEPLKWEFPGGKVEDGESPREALVREIREELALDVEVGELLGRGTSLSGGRRITLDVYAARLLGGTVTPAEHAAWGWFEADEIAGLDWAEADVPVLPALVERLRRP